MSGLSDLNRFRLPSFLICLWALAATLCISPLWYSLGPYTLKNFRLTTSLCKPSRRSQRSKSCLE